MFEQRTYSRKELALLYFPHCSPEAAYQALRRWLVEKGHLNPELMKEIRNRKNFPKSVVIAIVKLLGEP